MDIKTHIDIGEEKKLFFQSPNHPGNIIFLPNGMKLFNSLKDILSISLKKMGYQEVKCPSMAKQNHWKKSGHLAKYKEDMFNFTIDNNDEDGNEVNEENDKHYSLKPMNCPNHALIFKKMNPSQKDLPIRLMEFTSLFRNEPSNSLRGLFRLREFTQDDAHIFCTEEQIKGEVMKCLEFVKEFYTYFDFKFKAKLSTKPEKSIGSDEIWNKSTQILTECIAYFDNEFEINDGDGAFYGPKIDISIQDSKARNWQLGTIQLDFNLATNFNLKYQKTGSNNQNEFGEPIVIHRAIFGSIERFMAILLEHCQGKLPFCLSQNQIYITSFASPCSEKIYKYIQYLDEQLQEFNVHVDLTDNTLSKKVKMATLQHYHYICVIGNNEVDNNTISYRHSNTKNNNVPISDFYEILTNEFDFIDSLESIEYQDYNIPNQNTITEKEEIKEEIKEESKINLNNKTVISNYGGINKEAWLDNELGTEVPMESCD